MSSNRKPPSGKALLGLALCAVGVVYGDIGTSPLYAMKEAFSGHLGVPLMKDNILGVLSLIFWSLNFLITFKYLALMMRADNRGEGGVLALLALLRPGRITTRRRWVLIGIGLFGSALLYGDGVITPAISVLGAMEGLTVATPAFEPWVVPLSLVILFALFWVQKWGTAGVGAIFGPFTLVWFTCIAVLGISGILREPSVLQAVNPYHAVAFFLRHGGAGIFILAVVVLVVTGGEALYADMGHFGKRPIRAAWIAVVLPALLLNYFGQGGLLLSNPETIRNPFYELVPSWALYPMVVIATGAAVVASQALISGSFSLTRQALQLGYCPRVTIIHTSHTEEGQIYIPEVNWLIGAACFGLVIGFRSASNLAGTYGMAITGTMTVTTILFAAVARERWKWSWAKVLLFAVPILLVDLSFLFANLIKIPDGGWFPLLVAALVYTVMTTWKRGRAILQGIKRQASLPMELFLHDIKERKPQRVPGVAVFMTPDPGSAPSVLLHHLKHNKVLHERVVMFSVGSEEIPTVAAEDRSEFKELGEGFYQVVARYGFMETPDVPAVLESLTDVGFEIKPMETTYYLGRETLLRSGSSRFALWRKVIFIVMSRNAQSATAFFGIPPNRVVELGAQVRL
ncbi:MAG: potassium transporter Kup [Gemmatimonadales bacterium]|nr:potassium transporter Kup [Gemmatimonadales bacterium]